MSGLAWPPADPPDGPGRREPPGEHLRSAATTASTTTAWRR